jgi:peptidoglycan/xylan/chitin deacetylase (PgdA/CDA1 family)
MIKNPIPWPNGARCACAITFDMDADSLIHISRPADSHDRLYPVSMGKYGPEVAVPRILQTYERLGLKQSFFVPGWCIEQYPAAVESMLEQGHEVGHHGYLHEDPVRHSYQEQADWFGRAMDAHKRIAGNIPKGYRAPVYNINQGVFDLLLEYDFEYDSSLMGDDIPYMLEYRDRKLVEIPVHWGTDDWPPFAHYEEIGYMMPVKGPADGLQPFWEEFDAHYESGGFFHCIWHPFLTGRLARWRRVEAWLEKTLEEKKVWFAPLHEIARHVRDWSQSNPIRTDQLPYYREPPLAAAKARDQAES